MVEQKDSTKPTKKNYLKLLMQKAKKAVDLMIGNAEDYSREDADGDLHFDPRIMMKITVTFDKDFLPAEKIVKLNLRGARFFNETKTELREIHSIFVVYPHIYTFQIDTRKDEWEKKLIRELNTDYDLELQSIRFFNEEDISRIYQRAGILSVRNPYKLKEGELLIIAGGFTNFNFDGIPLCEINVEITPANSSSPSKKIYHESYYTKFNDKAGAYFHVGNEWYHNLFIPELFDNGNPFFFSVRIAEDGKNLKFFSDSKRTGIDIRGTVKTEITGETEQIIHSINREYLSGSNASELTLTASYDIEDKEDDAPVVEVHGRGIFKTDDNSSLENIHFPFLEDSMILLPSPNEEDIPSYIMKIGDDKKGIKFFASSTDKEISIIAPGKDQKIYKRHIRDQIDYSIKFGSLGYSLSNEFISRFGDKELKAYFSWELSSNILNRLILKEDFYVFGREPFSHLTDSEKEILSNHLVQLNEGIQPFWRIGVSRNHAIILREANYKYRIFNISSSFPVYVIRAEDLNKPVISPFRLEPPQGEKELRKIQSLLSEMEKKTLPPYKMNEILEPNTDNLELEKHDRIIIGNRMFKYSIPLIMESVLSSRAQMSVLRKIRESSSILLDQ